MGKNNARSLKIPSASWIRDVIKEEVKTQLEERESEKRAPRSAFMEDLMSESMDVPVNERDGWDGWWDASQRSERSEPGRRERARSEVRSKTTEGSSWGLWDGGDFMSDPIMEEGPRRTAPLNQDVESTERELEASISPVEKNPRARRTRATAKRR